MVRCLDPLVLNGEDHDVENEHDKVRHTPSFWSEHENSNLRDHGLTYETIWQTLAKGRNVREEQGVSRYPDVYYVWIDCSSTLGGSRALVKPDNMLGAGASVLDGAVHGDC